MITNEISKELQEYINANYKIEKADKVNVNNVNSYENTALEIIKDAGKNFSNKESFTLEKLVDEVGESFHEKLFFKIDMSGMNDVEVYNRANIDRKLFSKIRSNPAYHPRKQTILALAIALRLNLNETIDLLARAEYAMSPSNKSDIIVRYFIEKGIYDIGIINVALLEYGEQPLGVKASVS